MADNYNTPSNVPISPTVGPTMLPPWVSTALQSGDPDTAQSAMAANMIIQMMSGAGAGLIQAGLPSRIPISGRDAMNMGLLGAQKGINDATQGYYASQKFGAEMGNLAANTADRQQDALGKRIGNQQALDSYNRSAAFWGNPAAGGSVPTPITVGATAPAPTGSGQSPGGGSPMPMAPPDASMPQGGTVPQSVPAAMPQGVPSPQVTQGGAVNIPPPQAMQGGAITPDRIRALATNAVPWYTARPDELDAASGYLTGLNDPQSKAIADNMKSYAGDHMKFITQGGMFSPDGRPMIDPTYIKSQQDLATAKSLGEKLQTMQNGVVAPLAGALKTAGQFASASAYGTESGANAAKPAVLVPFFDKNNPMAPAVMVDTAHAKGAGGVPGYSQIGGNYVTKEGQGAGAAAQIGADKVVRDEAATNQSMIGRQGATLDIAANLQNDPTLKLGSWDKLSLPARNFLQSVGMNPLSDPNPQQAYEAVLSRLTFQEAPTLNVKTVRSGMLPLMNQVQGELGTNPNASRATMLIGKNMQGWDLNRIAAINKSTNAVQAENDYIAQNPVVNPGFKTMLDNTLHPESFSVPKSNVHDFQEWATKYQPFMTPAQRNQVGTILDNFGKGMNITGKTFKLGGGN